MQAFPNTSDHRTVEEVDRHIKEANAQPTQAAVQVPHWTHSCNALCVDDLKLWVDNCPHCGMPRHAAPEAPAQPEQSAGEVERGDVVAFEFYNRATGHAIVDYSVNTHVGNLSADKGYEARPLVYADKREEVTDGSKPIPLWQAREALDELEAAARGDEPFNHFAAGLVRSALEQAAAPEAPAQGEARKDRMQKVRDFIQADADLARGIASTEAPAQEKSNG